MNSTPPCDVEFWPPRLLHPAVGLVVGELLESVKLRLPIRYVHCHVRGEPVDALPLKMQSRLAPLLTMTQASAPRLSEVTVKPPTSGVGVTPSVAVRLTPPNAAVIVLDCDSVTAVVVTPNVADVAPAGTVALAGTTAAALLLASVTTTPAAPAAALNVTVPCAEFPPTTDAGATARVVSAAAAVGGGGVTGGGGGVTAGGGGVGEDGDPPPPQLTLAAAPMLRANTATSFTTRVIAIPLTVCPTVTSSSRLRMDLANHHR